MTNWITCPGCGLKHSPRPDGLCPRCRTRTSAAPSPGALPPPPPLTAQPFDGPPSPTAATVDPPSAPLPTSAWGGGAPAPAPAQSRPAVELSVGAIVNKSFSTWWKNVGRFSVVTLLAWAPLVIAAGTAGAMAAAGARDGAQTSDERLMVLVPFLVIGGLVSFVLLLAQFAGVTWGTLQLLAGRPATVGGMLSAGFRRFGAVLGAGIVATLGVMAGMLLLIVPGVILALGMAVVYPVVVSEELGPIDAIKRSFELTKGHRGTVFGALIVVSLAAGGVNMGSQLLTTVLGSMAAPLALLGALASLGIQLAMASLTVVVTAVAYHDLRVAKEGVDTSQLAKVFE